MTSKAFNQEHANQIMGDLARESIEALTGQGYGENIELYRSLEMRYFGQNHELEVSIDFETFDDASIASIWDKFHAAHKARYNFDIPRETIELISIKITAVSARPKPDLPKLDVASGDPIPEAEREVIFDDGPQATPVFQRHTLKAGHRITGPAVIEEAASVAVIAPGCPVRIDEYGNILIGDIAAS